MSRRYWLLAAAVIAFAVVSVGVWLVASHGSPRGDCAFVREMIAVNHEHSTQVDAQANAGVQATQDEYQQWADRLGELAVEIDDPKLAPQAHRMADLAHQSVALNSAVLAELSAPQPTAGPAAGQYAQLNRQFLAQQDELVQACPA
ncbi:hypothetical protein [Mycolicibacterium palauense]|uniref:hypothetical protein n=1 Tax=Mycolicibacterium palauense TaxID=2034511 RepID=UPI00114583C6|nr:hypothetical protein [Mycolicibacterium palauense]